MIEILDRKDISSARSLVFRTFPLMSISERLSFFIYEHQENKVIMKLMKLVGFAGFLDFWCIKNEDEVIGLIGLYKLEKDFNEAVWMAWFCVEESMRGKGLGKALIEYAIVQAKKYHVPFFRLYTSDEKVSKSAQYLYESCGFFSKKTVNKVFYKKIYREKVL